MSAEAELREIKIMLAGMQLQINQMAAGNSSKVYHMADLKLLFNVKRHETVMKRIFQLNIIPLPTRFLQVSEISLRKAGLL
jgi:hypothetical protein